MAYLDHAATAPMLPEAVDAYLAATGTVGNASSLHAPGRQARRRVEEAREQVATALDARPSEVIFTGGGTESDNLAVKGIYWSRLAEDPARRRILVSSVEHHAVLDSAQWLADHEGAELIPLEVDAFGRVHQDTLRAAIAEDPTRVAMVSVMWANNEVGTVNPVRELATTCAEYGIPFHTDAVQAVGGGLPVRFQAARGSALTPTRDQGGGPDRGRAVVPRRGRAWTPAADRGR